MNAQLAQKLYSLGFTYSYYEKNIFKGMLFEYKGKEYVIGGNTEEELTSEEKEIVKHGVWIPSDLHLMEWLEDNDFSFTITQQEHSYSVICRDEITKQEFGAEAAILELALFSVIRKILKKGERQFDYKQRTALNLNL